MTQAVQPRAASRRPFDERREPGWVELREVLGDLLDGDARDCVTAIRPLKSKVFRLELDGRGPWRSVVVKRLEPAVAQRSRLVVERWLPVLGLDDRCPRLLGTAADRAGHHTWHIYEDLGDNTLAARPIVARIEATVELVAELHTSAAEHLILPDVRRYGGALGMRSFTTNVRDAITALTAVRNYGIVPPPEFAAVPDQLLNRLHALRDDTPRRGRVFAEAATPDTLLHGDLWPINIFVTAGPTGLRARLVDWDRVGVGPFTYDLSAFLFRFPPAERPAITELYRSAVARAGWRLPPPAALDVLCDTAERSRYANCVIWPALAVLEDRSGWGFPALAEVERWFQALDAERQ